MEKVELLELLAKAKVSIHAYSVDGQFKDEAYHLMEEHGMWHVFYYERGKKNSFGYFRTLNDANEFFYKLLQKHLEF